MPRCVWHFQCRRSHSLQQIANRPAYANREHNRHDMAKDCIARQYELREGGLAIVLPGFSLAVGRNDEGAQQQSKHGADAEARQAPGRPGVGGSHADEERGSRQSWRLFMIEASESGRARI